MNIVLIITSSFLKPLFEKAVQKVQLTQPLNLNFKIVEYTNFDEIVELYDQNQINLAGVVFSGNYVMRTILLNRDITVPYVSISQNLVKFYGQLLSIVVNYQKNELNEVYIDYLIPFSKDPTLNYFIESAQYEDINSGLQKISNNLKANELETIDTKIKTFLLEQKKKNKVKRILCSLTNLIPFYEENQIPYDVTSPSLPFIIKSLTDLCQNINEATQTSNESIVGVIAVHKNEDLNRVNQLTQTFFRRYSIDAFTFIDEGFIYFMASQKSLAIITNNGRTNALAIYLSSNGIDLTHFGIGISNLIPEALSLAKMAVKESLSSNTQNVIMKPNGEIQYLDTYSEENKQQTYSAGYGSLVNEIAKQSNLSAFTIQKIYNLIQQSNNPLLTSKDLAAKLEVTPRNANRILKNLNEAGYAKIVTTSPLTKRGRPSRVYQILFHEIPN